MADNIEHVISYWLLFQKFHSPVLAGFADISHWTPFLLFSVYFGGIADRYDCRKVIQVAQIMYMGVSAAWAFLFFTDTIEVWHACVLLVIHGMAGVLWVILSLSVITVANRIYYTYLALNTLPGPSTSGAAGWLWRAFYWRDDRATIAYDLWVIAILAFALYPQLALEKGEQDTVRSIAPAQAAAGQEVAGR